LSAAIESRRQFKARAKQSKAAAKSELHWPTKYFPPRLLHDFDCILGHGVIKARVRFYPSQRAYGVPLCRAALRAFAVTVFWYAFGKWRRRPSLSALRRR
jgi:hypothetical protein